MSLLERWLWGIAGTVALVWTAVNWWRFEKALKTEQRRHQAEMDEIDREIRERLRDS